MSCTRASLLGGGGGALLGHNQTLKQMHSLHYTREFFFFFLCLKIFLALFIQNFGLFKNLFFIIIIIDIYMAHIAEACKCLETQGRVEMT